MNGRLSEELATYCSDRIAEFDRISAERQQTLDLLARAVGERLETEDSAEVIFICTHNSRRSHLTQLWAQTAAHLYGVGGVSTFSGGTEATAFNPSAVAAVRRAGFSVRRATAGDNPIYRIRCDEQMEAMECFSKVYDEPPNPQRGFIAVLTCSAADAACPVVEGAAARIAIPYDDPKDFDGTPREAAVYDERCRQIAREMLSVFRILAAGRAIDDPRTWAKG